MNEDNSIDALAARLGSLSTRLRSLAADRPPYLPATCDSCIAACKNFVRLTYALPTFDGNNNASSSSASSSSSSTSGTSDPPVAFRPSRSPFAFTSSSSPSSSPSGDNDKENNNTKSTTWEWSTSNWSTGDVERATRGMWDLVTGRIVESAALYDYKTCLADCIDDAAHVYSQQVADCAIRAKTESDLAACTERLATSAREFRQLEREARRVERVLEAQLSNK
ncbi:hypothetical protein BC828DRAFT_408356 [Blastocladiella britannica]|nr:hypothetical protein BC828DRAFT_408356 [Blastocladiella britannica]